MGRLARKLYLVLSVMALLLSASCMSPRNFSDLDNTRGVSMVYTSSAMLRLTGGLASSALGVDLSKVLNKIGSVRVIIAENPSASHKAKSVVDHQIKKIKAKPMFEVSGSGMGVKGSGIYVTTDGPDTFDNVVIVNNSDPQSYKAIFLAGRLTVADLQSLGL